MKRLSDQTLYEILEVPPDAPPDEIAAAYDRARALYGPGSLVTYTLMSPEEAAALTSRIEEAKRTLLDDEARARYDASLASAPAAPRAETAGANGANGIDGARRANGSNGVSQLAFAAMPLPPLAEADEEADERDDEAADAEPLDAAASALVRAPAGGPPVAASAPPADVPPPAARSPIRLERPVEASGADEPTVTKAPRPVTASPAPPATDGPVPMPDGALWTGDALRKVREARGITVQQISERTKVTRHHLENIEAERFSALPAPVYLRGILLTIARELRLDGQKVARAYLERVAAAAAQDGKPR